MASFPVAHGGGAAPQLPQANADWQSIVGNLFGNYAAGQQYGQERRVQTGREEVLKNLGPNPDWTLVSQQLLGLGDLKGAGIAADIAQTKENYSFRNQQAGIQNQQWQQQFDANNRAREDAKVPTGYRPNPETGGYQAIPGGPADPQVVAATSEAKKPPMANPPAGYRWNAGGTSLEAIPGGPGEKIDAEVAARLGLTKSFLGQLPDIVKSVEAGDATGLIDGPAGYLGLGRAGEIRRQVQSGVDALIRNLTGAGMAVEEAKNYAARYSINPTDRQDAVLSKLKQLDRELRSTAETLGRGRGGAEFITALPSPFIDKDQSRAPQNTPVGRYGSAPANAAPAPQPQSAPPQPQTLGTLIPGTTNSEGWIYKGGNPNDAKSWVKQ